MQAYIGTSGFSYNHWKTIFYPKDLPKSGWLSYYSKYFLTLELNVTFYRLPSKESFQKWFAETPDNFSFSVKGPRLITHYHRLNNIEESLKLFYENVGELKDKCKVILWQFPPQLEADQQKLNMFCQLLSNHPYKHAFEFRNKNWFDQKIYGILKKYNYALVSADWPFPPKELITPQTADFVYLRRHGSKKLYSSSYSKTELKNDAIMIRNFIAEGKTVFTYFNNDAEGNAIMNALELEKILRKKPSPNRE